MTTELDAARERHGLTAPDALERRDELMDKILAEGHRLAGARRDAAHARAMITYLAHLAQEQSAQTGITDPYLSEASIARAAGISRTTLRAWLGR